MSIHLDSEDNRRNKFVDQILKDLLEINKLQGISIKKMKADQNGIFYVEQEISIEDLLKNRRNLSRRVVAVQSSKFLSLR